MVNTHVHLLGFYSGLFAGSHNLKLKMSWIILTNTTQNHWKIVWISFRIKLWNRILSRQECSCAMPSSTHLQLSWKVQSEIRYCLSSFACKPSLNKLIAFKSFLFIWLSSKSSSSLFQTHDLSLTVKQCVLMLVWLCLC